MTIVTCFFKVFRRVTVNSNKKTIILILEASLTGKKNDRDIDEQIGLRYDSSHEES